MAALLSFMTVENIWLAFGLFAQGMFASRFLIQLFKSEMEGRSVIPEAFWYFSLAGGLMTLVYSIHLGKDGIPFILGQCGSLFVYVRNIQLIFREKRRNREKAAPTE
jgi:lipid-A-disaccharide synthase-like uncharacterized protein